MTSSPRLVHCMMHVGDLERAIAFYERALHFAVADRHRYEGHDLAYLRSPASAIEIELVKPDARQAGSAEPDTSWRERSYKAKRPP